jgi:hypothetical protein
LTVEFAVTRYWKNPQARPPANELDSFAASVGAPSVRFRGYHPCGFLSMPALPPGYMPPFMEPVIAAAYRDCHAVTVERLEARVAVSAYPAGHFGALARHGMLVVARHGMVDEARLQALYSLIAEAVDVATEPSGYWEQEAEEEASMDQYRREPGFRPDFAFDFWGTVPLRGELNLAKRRLLLISGNDWASYELDAAITAGLADFLADQKGPDPLLPPEAL